MSNAKSKELSKLDNISTTQSGLTLMTDYALTEAQKLIDSKLLPENIKTPEQALIIIQKGKELGFKVMQAFDSIDVIMGKPSLKPRAKGSLARASGLVRWKFLRDWEPVVDENGEVVDIITEIQIERKYDDGWYPDIATFKYSEAVQMGYMNKPNWKSQPNVMAKWRCLSRGLDQVCPDLTGGLYMSDELADHSNVQYVMTADGDFKVIDNN